MFLIMLKCMTSTCVDKSWIVRPLPNKSLKAVYVALYQTGLIFRKRGEMDKVLKTTGKSSFKKSIFDNIFQKGIPGVRLS